MKILNSKGGAILIPCKYESLTPFDEQGFTRATFRVSNRENNQMLIDTFGNAFRLAGNKKRPHPESNP